MRLSKKQVEAIDRLVAEEGSFTRPEAIRRAVEHLDKAVRRSRRIDRASPSQTVLPATGQLELWTHEAG